MMLLKNVEVASHHDDQQAPSLCFDGSKTARHPANAVENRGGQQRKEPVDLIPTVEAGRQLKHAHNELAKQDQQRIKTD